MTHLSLIGDVPLAVKRCEIASVPKGTTIESSCTHGANPSLTIPCAAASICLLETLSTITTPDK